jgi:SAM-dependent methyltransferase
LVDTGEISCCFDEASQRMLKDYRNHGLGETSEDIVDALVARGLPGSSVLELGCGFGALTQELVRRGASSAVGVDLSPRMVQLAKVMAEESGLKSVTYELGDGAVARLRRSDFVVLDNVLCCYPDVVSLVENSSSAASRYYVISIPDDTRVATRFLRVLLPLQRLMRRGGFRFFIHPTSTIRRMLESKGFRLEYKTGVGLIWSVFIFAAPQPG